MVVGYARVSTVEQNLDRQLDILKKEGCEIIFEEKTTGAKIDRIELKKLMDYIRPNDIIIVTELSRLSRSVKDLFFLVEEIEKKKAHLKSLKEPWADTTTVNGKLMFSIFAGISQYERDLISLRTREGLKAARARGRFGGRPCLEHDKIDLALRMYNEKKYTISEIVKAAGISKASLYKYINKNKTK